MFLTKILQIHIKLFIKIIISILLVTLFKSSSKPPVSPFITPSTPHTLLSSPHSGGRHFLRHDSVGEDLHCGPHQLLRHTCVLQTYQFKKLMILTNNLTLKLITNLFILCFFLPDLGQVPGLQQDLMRYWELEKEE